MNEDLRDVGTHLRMMLACTNPSPCKYCITSAKHISREIERLRASASAAQPKKPLLTQECERHGWVTADHQCEPFTGVASAASTPQEVIETLREELRVTNALLNERNRLLALFECPKHGACVPFAIEEVERLRAALASQPSE